MEGGMMLWWQIPYAILLILSVYAYPTYVLWTWPVEVEIEPDPRGREGLPIPFPVPLTLVARGCFLSAGLKELILDTSQNSL